MVILLLLLLKIFETKEFVYFSVVIECVDSIPAHPHMEKTCLLL